MLSKSNVLKHVTKRRKRGAASRGAASRRCLILGAHQSAGEALIAAARANNVEEVSRLTVHRDPTVLEYRDEEDDGYQVQSHPIISNHNKQTHTDTYSFAAHILACTLIHHKTN